jgi:L-threonylcarbamoyladenylate synthase
LAEQSWPGPLTLVVPRRADAGLADAVTAGLPTIALRAPAHPVMRALLAATNFPLAAPSANRSGFISPTMPAHVLASLDGRIAIVLDGGACAAGVESTIIAVRSDGSIEELRPGPLQIATGGSVSAASIEARIEAPGQLASHYAPGKPVRLNATEAAPNEFLIGFGSVAGDCTLSASGELTEAAARLYACLHQAALASQPRIAVAPVPDYGVGRAINDRLRRAAA